MFAVKSVKKNVPSNDAYTLQSLVIAYNNNTVADYVRRAK